MMEAVGFAPVRSRTCRTALLALALVASLQAHHGFAATVCEDRAPAAIVAAAEAGLKCQKTIANEGWKYLNTRLKAESACRLKEPTGACPGSKDETKINKATAAAAAKIQKDCGADAVQAALASAYAAHSDAAIIPSCMLSQHGAQAALVLGNTTGVSTEPFPGQDEKARAKCIKELSKSGIKYVLDAHKTMRKCLDKKMKDAAAGDLSPLCIGRWEAGAFIPPTDAKTAEKLAKLQGKIETKVAKSCESGETLGYIPSIFACAGADSVADLQACLICQGWDAALATLEQAYAETGTYVASGPGALQTAVSAASPGTKLLIASGDYVEQVTIAAQDLALVGCGGASGARPRVVRPAGAGAFANGIFATGVDGLVFQSLEVVDWDDNGIFVVGADGITFRDVIADGNLNSEYGVFPVRSNDVLVEASEVIGVTDAGIYVGQSNNIVVRYNEVHGNVAGIEVENSGNAEVHNNHAYGNTGGILVFKLAGLSVQLSDCHDVHHNVSIENNVPNFGAGIVGMVPAGTGMLVLSNDTGVFAHNIIRGNDSLGLAVTDQAVLNLLFSPPPFPAPSPDYLVENNFIVSNEMTGNGTNPDPVLAGLVSGDAGFLITPAVGNCQSANTFGTEVGFAALPACALPPSRPGCPVPAVVP